MSSPTFGPSDSTKVGDEGRLVTHGRKTDVLRLALMSLYGILMAGFIAFSGKVHSRWERILQTGDFSQPNLLRVGLVNVIYPARTFVAKHSGKVGYNTSIYGGYQ